MAGELPREASVRLAGPWPRGAAAVRARAADYVELTKPGITLFILVTAAIGFQLAPGAAPSAWLFLRALLGIALVTAGGAALNNWVEREVDGRMRRTAGRPLPAGRLSPAQAAVFGAALATTGVLLLALAVRPLTALLAVVSLGSYVGAYTPLKRRTTLCTVVGGVPGALPALGGWTAAGAALTPAAWSLFGIVFLWQIPHFLSLAWMYRDDYRRGGLRVLPAEDPTGRRTGRQALAFSLALVPMSLLPALTGLAGPWYAAGALLLGTAYAGLALLFLWRPTREWARRLFLASLIYLPAAYVLMGLDASA